MRTASTSTGRGSGTLPPAAVRGFRRVENGFRHVGSFGVLLSYDASRQFAGICNDCAWDRMFLNITLCFTRRPSASRAMC